VLCGMPSRGQSRGSAWKQPGERRGGTDMPTLRDGMPLAR